MNLPHSAIVLCVLLLVACGQPAPVQQPDRAVPAAESVSTPQAPARAITLADIFNGGSYRCTVETPQGTFTLKIKEKKFRYEGTVEGRPFSTIAEYGVTETTTYTYLAPQDRWLKMSFPNSAAKNQQGIITKENAAQYPKHECYAETIPDSVFSVPEEKVVDQQQMLAAAFNS